MSLFQWAILALSLSLSAGTLGFADTGLGSAGHGSAVVARGFFGVLLAVSLLLLVLVVLGFGG